MSEDIQKVFDDDSKSKKRTANGSFGRVKGSRRGMVSAYSLMTKAQQQEYTQCEDGPTYNIYETVISIERLRHLPSDVRLQCWAKWSERFYIEDIMLSWSIETIDELNAILIDLDMPLVEIEDELEGAGSSHNSDEITLKEQLVTEDEEHSWLSLSDLVAEDAKVLDFTATGLMETNELVTELKKMIDTINDSQRRRYSVEIRINEII